MPAKHKPFVVYTDPDILEQIEVLRAYISEKEGKRQISDGHIGRELISEKFREVIDKENNRARITTIVERLDRIEAVLYEILRLLNQLEGD